SRKSNRRSAATRRALPSSVRRNQPNGREVVRAISFGRNDLRLFGLACVPIFLDLGQIWYKSAMLRAILFLAMITSALASETLKALVDSASTFSAGPH